MKLAATPSGRVVSVNTVLVLVAVNCALLVFQIATSTAPGFYERGIWRPQPTACANITTPPLDETLNTTSFDLSRGEVRAFRAHGVATRLIVEVGSYRNGPRTFSAVVMTSKRLNNLHEILYDCEWASSAKTQTAMVRARAIKPDWNMGLLYGTMVLVCEFPHDVGADAASGRLVLTAGYGNSVFRAPERFVALTERPGDCNASRYAPPYPYEITFCGSPLYGDISPQRIREWVAYHAWLLGPHTLFIFHDAGGIHHDVYRVLQPWIALGRVRVENLRQAEVYEGYYHHQFTTLNDCLLRSQTLANWTFFFDVDEFLHIPNSAHDAQHAVTSLLAAKAHENVTQILFPTVKVSNALCQKQSTRGSDSEFLAQISRWGLQDDHILSKNAVILNDVRRLLESRALGRCRCPWRHLGRDVIAGFMVTKRTQMGVLRDGRDLMECVRFCRKWAIEKLVYASCDYGWTPDESRKYAVQPQRVWATGVHYSEHMKLGRSEDLAATALRAYHYHNTVNARREVCRAFPSSPSGEPNSLNVRNCSVDRSMAALAPIVQRFELAMVGEQPFIL